MDLFSVLAALLAPVALFSYLNYRYIYLPTTIGVPTTVGVALSTAIVEAAVAGAGSCSDNGGRRTTRN